jgi:hypothetical protein
MPKLRLSEFLVGIVGALFFYAVLVAFDDVMLLTP